MSIDLPISTGMDSVTQVKSYAINIFPANYRFINKESSQIHIFPKRVDNDITF